MYHPSLLSKLRNIKLKEIQKDELISYASQFYMENETLKA